jgi:tRNA(Arg) A34 adenosine deaminase TadA
MFGAAALAATGFSGSGLASPLPDLSPFVAEAFRMKREAVAGGDQPYGAVMVFEGEIVGYGPSRVVQDRNEDAHAERVALWNAQKRMGRERLDGAVIVSTSRPCAICQRALARAGVTRMIHGETGIDAGPPRG